MLLAAHMQPHHVGCLRCVVVLARLGGAVAEADALGRLDVEHRVVQRPVPWVVLEIGHAVGHVLKGEVVGLELAVLGEQAEQRRRARAAVQPVRRDMMMMMMNENTNSRTAIKRTT